MDSVRAAHTTVHGTGAGRREATRQIDHGYAVLLAAEFQGHCRELHSEAVARFVANLPATQQNTVADALALNRQRDRGNAHSGSLGSDFGRLGIDWWPAVDRIEPDGLALRKALDGLNAWRNAIAHNDFASLRLGGTIALKLSMVREWRRACHRLARGFDRVSADHLAGTTGHRPW